jgi:two-component system, NtrC family, sensor kinase
MSAQGRPKRELPRSAEREGYSNGNDSHNRETINAQTQRLAALGFMVAGVCHEVASPLAAVHSMLQILQSKRGVTPETMEKGLASISANIARVLAITRKLGEFSRVGSDAPTAVSVDAAMEEAFGLLRHGASSAKLRMTYRGVPEVHVLARPGTLQQVLFNILQNAAQAMNGAGSIDAHAHVERGEIRIRIRDDGPGIAADVLPRIFEPFFTTKAAGEGTGLGLAISYEITQEIGGTIHASNHPDGGACFDVILFSIEK